MNSQYIEQAMKVVPSKQLLVNMVSKRVRQLMAGSRPLIEIETRMGLADIALSVEVSCALRNKDFLPFYEVKLS